MKKYQHIHDDTHEEALNVLGQPLIACCFTPTTGFFRDGFCRTINADQGSHTVCALMTDEFLSFSKQQGNDLSTPRPEFDFLGLKAGDHWCVCASRWLQAYEAGQAPQVVLAACDQAALDIVPEEALYEYAVDRPMH